MESNLGNSVPVHSALICTACDILASHKVSVGHVHIIAVLSA